ncbi:MAG: protein kinase [Pyrinomonadaceae bacterium]
MALKVLPTDITRDQGRLRRFEQEAYAASALNHPNIITIYEIGQIDHTPFIATEFIDGVTLRQRITSGGIGLVEALEVAMQAAGALAAAHEAGIIHRDIKPENIMLRRDGYVKVLDFGLAKLTQDAFRQASSASDASTKTMMSTEPGVVMGTISYMSPEQTQGHAIDARTDIWSLGIVLYEMLSGAVPFKGPTNSHVIVSILEKELPALFTQAGHQQAPAELERIIDKALQKDREERYQTIKDLLLDLKRLKRRLEINAEPEPAMQSSFGDRRTVIQGVATGAKSAGEPSIRVTAAEAARLTMNVEEMVKDVGRRRRTMVAVTLVVIAAAGIVFAFSRFFDQGGSAPSFGNMKVVKLTNNGKAKAAAISPDGKYVVYAVSDAGKQSLWLRMVAAASSVQIVAPADVVYKGLTFSREGTYIYYVAREREMSTGTLYRVPALGGAVKKLLENIDTPVSLSPDDKRLAFVRNDPSKGESALMVSETDGTAERKLATRNRPNTYDWPAWSPNGKVIASTVRNVAGALHMSIVEVPADGGAERSIASQKWSWCGQIQWLAAGDA